MDWQRIRIWLEMTALLALTLGCIVGAVVFVAG